MCPWLAKSYILQIIMLASQSNLQHALSNVHAARNFVKRKFEKLLYSSMQVAMLA